MIYLMGDSHTTCMLRAAKKMGEFWVGGERVKLAPLATARTLSQPIYQAKKGRLAFNDQMLRTRLRALSGKPNIPDASPDYYGMSLGLHTFRVCINSMWAHYSLREFASEDGKMPVSEGLLKEVFDQDSKNAISFYRLAKKKNIKVFAIDAPPLNRKILELTGAKARTIAKIDTLYREYVRSQLRALNIPVVEVFNEAKAEDGFLSEDYVSEFDHDVRHGNVAYGARMLNQISDFVEKELLVKSGVQMFY